MIHHKHLLLLGLSFVLYVSCSKSLTDLGYESRAINTSVHVENQFLRSLNTSVYTENYGSFKYSIPTFYSYSGGYVTHNRSYNIYNVIADEDIDNIFKVYVSLRMDVLRDFYSNMSARYFDKKTFDKEYLSLCSPSVWQYASDYAASNNAGDIGGWQIFKPYPGLDAPEAKYKITYEGEDWFEVVPVGDNEKVRLKVVLAGKAMHPVIVEVDNPHFGVNATTDSNADVGKGYEYKQQWNRNGNMTLQRSRAYFDWLTSTISSNCRTKERNYVTEASFIDFFNRTVQNRQQLLDNFYKDLSSKDFNRNKFSHKYNSWIYADVEKAMYGKKQDNDNALGKWQAFDSNTDEKEISYEGNNWFRLAEKMDTANVVHVQMVYCGKKMQPMVVGLKNPFSGVDVGKDLDTDRYTSRGWPWVNR